MILTRREDGVTEKVMEKVTAAEMDGARDGRKEKATDGEMERDVVEMAGDGEVDLIAAVLSTGAVLEESLESAAATAQLTAREFVSPIARAGVTAREGAASQFLIWWITKDGMTARPSGPSASTAAIDQRTKSAFIFENV